MSVDWQRSDVRDPDVRLRLLDELVVDLLLDGAIDGAELSRLLQANRTAAADAHRFDVARVCLRTLAPDVTYSDVVVMALALRFSEGQLATLATALRAGAGALELLELGVHGLNWSGEDLQVLTPDELQTRVETTLRIEQLGNASRWLAGYAKLLAAEFRRRRGA